MRHLHSFLLSENKQPNNSSQCILLPKDSVMHSASLNSYNSEIKDPFSQLFIEAQQLLVVELKPHNITSLTVFSLTKITVIFIIGCLSHGPGFATQVFALGLLWNSSAFRVSFCLAFFWSLVCCLHFDFNLSGQFLLLLLSLIIPQVSDFSFNL